MLILLTFVKLISIHVTLGVRKYRGVIEYLAEMKNTRKLQPIKSVNAMRKLPVHVVEFLETKLEWFRLGVKKSDLHERPVASEIIDGKPVNIHCK